MKQHRDNNSKRVMLKVRNGDECAWKCGTCTGIGDSGCQVPGSSVAVFTIGTKAMTMLLRYPHNDTYKEDMTKYVIHPSFTMRLGPGTLFILDPVDDVHFTHEAHFDFTFGEDDGVRIAYVFRHCQQVHMFHTHPNAKRQIHVPLEDIQRREAERKRRRAREAKRRRDALFRRLF